jgi:hypothetical protein
MVETLIIDDIKSFFSRYRKFTGDRTQLRLREFKMRLGHTRVALQSIKTLFDEYNRNLAGDFNLFSLLGVERFEVATHSAFLGALLNPQGTHGQMSLFLETFFRHCSEKFGHPFPTPNDDIGKATWYVDKEKVTAFGNLDLVISCPDLQFLLVIENKIGAVEQPDQLKRYAEWTDSQQKYFNSRILIYLTPRGVESSSAHGRKYYPLSYHEDIKSWLEKSYGEIQAPRVKDAILQYLQVLKNL